MRTTITIDDKLLEKLKQRAAEVGSTVSRLIEDAVRLSLRSSPEQDDESGFRLITYGAEASFTQVNIDKSAALVELDDLDRFPR